MAVPPDLSTPKHSPAAPTDGGEMPAATDSAAARTVTAADRSSNRVLRPPVAEAAPLAKGERARHAPVDRPWAAVMARATIRLLGRIPLPILHAGGTLLGRISATLHTTTRHISRINLGFCLPDFTATRRRDLERRSLEHLGRAFCELSSLWARDKQGIQDLVRKVHGQQYLDAARASGRGVVFASAHLGSWEFLGLWISTHFKAVGLYRRPRIKQLNDVILKGRCKFGGTMLEASPGSLRQLIRALRRDECVWMVADQVPGKGAGVWAPFFGKPALTGTLLPRLVASTGASVVWAFAERLPRGQGFDIHLYPADDRIGSRDLDESVAAVIGDVERMILECPEQYLWRYKRFRKTRDGSPSPYK